MSGVPQARDHLYLTSVPAPSPSEPRRGSKWVAVGKGTLLVPAAHG